MKIIDILQEANHTTHTMQKIYTILSKEYNNLSGVNSGMVALAISRFFKLNLKSIMKISLIYENKSHATSVCDLVTAKPPSPYLVVANKFGQMTYTADYEGSVHGLISRIESKLPQDQKIHLDIISDLDYDSDCIQGLINKHTPQGSPSSGDYYDCLVKGYFK
jgi:hypothetical protein